MANISIKNSILFEFCLLVSIYISVCTFKKQFLGTAKNHHLKFIL